MANNTFSDFSALKSLKKELEKQDAPLETSKPANEPRPKTVTLKTKDEILGDRKARETGLQPGMRVTLMDSSDRGVIRKVKKDCVDIELDYGFVVPVAFNGFVVNDADEDFKLRHSIGSSKSKPVEEDRPVPVPKSLEIDLHIEALPGGLNVPKGQELPFQLEHFKSVMRSQLKHRGNRVIFVHGVGDGVLKKAIRDELDTTFAISCAWSPYGDGATAVTIK
ncbi:MAG: hypothetical protein Q4G10_06425 [Bacteroidia bacterium]|nr:hypothetical protein [Bacteroidia bacterium]